MQLFVDSLHAHKATITLFDIPLELVVARIHGKFQFGPVAHHKSIQFGTLQMCYPNYQCPAKAMIDKFILFFLQKPLLKSHHPPVLSKLKGPDYFIKVETHSRWGDGGEAFKIGTVEIEGRCIIFPVLNGIPFIIGRHYQNFFKYAGIYMQGYLKVLDIANGEDRVFRC